MRDDIEARLIRLEQLIDEFARTSLSPQAEEGHGDASAAALRLRTAVLRLQSLCGELGRREGSLEWDGADAMTARLILADLSQALGACRALSENAKVRVARVQSAVDQARETLEPESSGAK